MRFDLEKWDAVNRLALFLKLRKGKTITDKTIKQFRALMERMHHNFKDHNQITISEWKKQEYEAQSLALRAIRGGFIKFETGGGYRLSDVDEFSLYTDGKHRVKIKGQQVEITPLDYKVLNYIFFEKN